jgi:mannose-6-phosphate isomerase class I
MNAYPIKMTYHVRSYYFGERLIPDLLGERVAPDGVVAETWEISDYKDTTGRVTNGEHAGKTLHDLVTGFPEELVREGWSGPHFPLLEKVLDASHMLPVHLHPDDETAQKKHGEPHGKTEAWHILWAAEEATILAGIKEGLTREELFEAFKVQDYDAVMPRHPVRAGDTVYVPGGIIHTAHPERSLTLSNVGDPVRIEYAGGTERLEWAESCVLPAAIGEVRVIPEGEASLISCYVPDLERDVISPLREAGYSDEEIRGLGQINV